MSVIKDLLWRVVEPSLRSVYNQGRADEREGIIAEASRLRATIPADHPKGAQASFAHYLKITAKKGPV